MILSLIVAASENNVIGKDNALIWHLSADLKRFKVLTTGHTVIMGRKTYESIGRPLPHRRNIVISGSLSSVEGVEVVSSIEAALKLVEQEEEVFIMGGGSIYQALWKQANRLYLTRVETEVEGDTFIPGVEASEWKEMACQRCPADEKNKYPYSFIDYVRN